MDSSGSSRRAFLRTTALAAAVVAADGVISLDRDPARGSSADRTPLPDYDRYDGMALAGLVKARQVSADELLEAAIERVEQRNPATNAVVNRMYDQAKAAIAAGLPAGQFTGVPYLLKDLGPVYAGTVTTFGSSIFRNFVADHDSEFVVRLRRAGLVIFGKTHSPEFGLSTSSESRLFGATRNPWNPEHSAGGSSGGSAAAIAAGMLPMAHGTDGGGSIRIPASCCGLFGLKPTRARTPFGPDFGERWSGLASGHAVTSSVRDSAALLDATSGPDVGDPYSAPPPSRPYLLEVGADPGRLKIAFTTKAWNGHAVDAECVAAVAAAARLCESLGHHLEEASPPIDEAARSKAVGVIVTSQTRLVLQRAATILGREATPEDVETMTWGYAEYARQFSASDYANAVDVLHRTGRVVGRFFTRYDALLTPTMCTPPHKLGVISMMRTDVDAYRQVLFGDIAFTSPFNSSGHPAMSVPLHWSAAGLPVGVQFVARFGDEATLFRLAAQLESAQPWADRRPAPVR
ncbi:MAG TPA: amidase [Burkholderiales bacterium]|nr:amidase [Burkholderiales bacterium]